MSGENRRSWLLPLLIIAVGAYFFITGMQGGTLSAVSLKSVNWAGIVLMAGGIVAAFFKKPAIKLLGVLACGVGAILVICL